MYRNPTELEELIVDWEYFCPDLECRNRTFVIDTDSKGNNIRSDLNGSDKYLTIRILKCSRCSSIYVIGTYYFKHSDEDKIESDSVVLKSDMKMLSTSDIFTGSLSSQVPRHPKEYIAFTEPALEKPLPNKLPLNIKKSYREAEFAISHNKPISAAASIRNTIRLIVEKLNISEKNFKSQIKKLPFSKDYIDAFLEMKIIGDHTLHYEEYSINDLKPALNTLYIALKEYYDHLDNIKALHKSVSNKASQKAKSEE